MTQLTGMVDRLPFALPDFTRHSWVGDAARQQWEPRFERIRQAWAHIEWLSVRAQVRSCALVGLSPSALSASTPLWEAERLSAKGLAHPEGPPGIRLAVVGGGDAVRNAHDAWVARDDDALGILLGYPECCRRFFREVWVDQRATDTTWSMATNTTAPRDSLVVLEASTDRLANILWRWLGVRAVPHLPCRFDCPASTRFGEQLLQVGEHAGYADEVSWIRDILAWPVEWSALHGIAEVKTPLLKLSTRTDASASKYTVRWTGTAYPSDGATGLRFPYRAPTRRLITEGRSFQLGLKRPIEKPRTDRSWYHLDNGFSSAEGMSELHRPIVALARRVVEGRAGNILDLGCGNGALLAKICHGHSGATPYGVDTNPTSLVHAADVLPSFARHFSAADLFDCDAWSSRRYALSLIMAGRLLEVERPRAERLLQVLRAQSDTILLYAYPGGGGRPLVDVARELGLGLDVPAEATAGLLTNAAHQGVEPVAAIAETPTRSARSR